MSYYLLFLPSIILEKKVEHVLPGSEVIGGRGKRQE
jgi:hypothetical protein